MPPSIKKSFNPSTILFTGVSTLIFTITNPNNTTLFGIAFADNFPVQLFVATPNGLFTTCGGTPVANSGSGSVSLAGGTLAANATCTLSVNVTSALVNSYPNTSGNVSSTNGGTGNTATDTLFVQLPLTDTPTVTPTHTTTSTPTVTNTPTITPTRRPNGSSCTAPSQCATGFCANGVCCDTACTGIDQRCDLPDQAGTCGRAAASAPTLTPWGLIAAALILTAVAAFALRHRMRRS